MDDCPKCRRIAHPQWNGCEDTFCFIEGGEVCRAVAAAYANGVRMARTEESACDKCGSYMLTASMVERGSEEWCSRCAADEEIAAEAYARGIRDMLAVAKRTAMTRDDYSINWRETEREAAKLAGEG